MSVGLVMLGHKVLETIGKEVITLDTKQGFCVQFATSIAIMIGSMFGVPVSSTHCNIGSLLGLTIAAKFKAVQDVYPAKEEKEENRINKDIMIKIFLWWLITVPFVFSGTTLFTMAVV